MKYIFLFCLIGCLSRAAFGQVVNPTIIYQDTDIALHNTDVYYRPFAPPNSTDTRMGLSCLGSMDSDGILHYYYPIFHGHPLDSFKLCDTCPMVGNATPGSGFFPLTINQAVLIPILLQEEIRAIGSLSAKRGRRFSGNRKDHTKKRVPCYAGMFFPCVHRSEVRYHRLQR